MCRVGCLASTHSFRMNDRRVGCEITTVCIEYMADGYSQAERLMLVMKVLTSDTDNHDTVTSATLAKLSPPAKRTGHIMLSLCRGIQCYTRYVNPSL